MHDIKTTPERSKNMSAIRHRDTKPELILRRALHKRGWRYRVTSNLFGKPDIVFTKAKLAVFVDGCFWHGCPECYQKPASNKQFWEQKLLQNKERDRVVNKELSSRGWEVLRFWEHEVKNNSEAVVGAIESYHKGRGL